MMPAGMWRRNLTVKILLAVGITVAIALRYIFGLGPVNAVEICEKVKIPVQKPA